VPNLKIQSGGINELWIGHMVVYDKNSTLWMLNPLPYYGCS